MDFLGKVLGIVKLENVRKLRDEARKLEDMKAELRIRVDAAKYDGRIVLREVETWLTRANDTQAMVSDFEPEINATQNTGFNRLNRYSLNKRVKLMIEAMRELQKSCDFKNITRSPPPPALVSIPGDSIFECGSRKDIEEGIMVSLKDDETYKVGICGMEGVGKTTMTGRIMRRAREEHLFEEIVMVVVSQSVDMLRIRDDIATSLDLNLGDGSLSSKAHTLRTRLTAGTKRSLIVVDDVWECLNLDDLGIPCNSWCRVLVTSRDSGVLRRMNVVKIHEVKVLTKAEAWHLFEMIVGSRIDNPDVVSVAEQVVEECKGLPLALVTVGSTLKDMEDERSWKDWLHQLRSPNPDYEVRHGLHKPLRLSYDFLENEEAQSLFLLCCLYPEDSDIPLDELALYAMGLGMLKGIDRLEQARTRVCRLVEKLKSRFLLLEGRSKNDVKMHDVFRDFAISIASEKKWITSDNNSNDCTWISPYTGESINKLQARSTDFSSLHLLWVDCYSRDEVLDINDGFFEGMKALNVFSINGMRLRQLPQTTRLLENLKTLVLSRCEYLQNISVVGELVNLEILICCWCVSIKSLPKEIGRLSRLKLLEILNCKNLKKIAPGIISKLKGLEELNVWGCFDGWQAENIGRKIKNASLSKLHHLSNLILLKIMIKDSRLAAEQILLPPNLMKYHIKIGNLTPDWKMDNYPKKGRVYENKMELRLPANICLGKWIRELVKSVEYMNVEGDGGSSLDFGVAQNLRMLVFGECSTVTRLVSTKTTATVFPLLETLRLEKLVGLKEICDNESSDSFNNLQELTLQHLPALERLNIVSTFNKLSSICLFNCNKLSSMMTRGSSLPSLEKLGILSCYMMEQVLLWDEEQLVFPKLKFLELRYLPRLTSFSKGIESIEFPVLDEMIVEDCKLLKSFVCSTGNSDDDGHCDDDCIHIFCKPDKVKFDCLSKLTLLVSSDEGSRARNWCPQISLDFFARLRKLELCGYKNMKSLFSFSMIESDCLSQLEVLKIRYCNVMEELMMWEEEEENQTHIHMITLFSNLKFLSLHSLPRLRRLLSEGAESVHFNLPPQMVITECPLLLESCVSSSTTSSSDSIHLLCKTDKIEFGSLKELDIGGYIESSMRRNWCPMMIDIFTGLSKLSIHTIEGMKSLFPSSLAQNLHNMTFLSIARCGEMVRVIEDDGETPPTPLLPNLVEIQLYYLPKLKSFCECKYALEFPSLISLSIEDCDLMEEFTSGHVSSPILPYIDIGKGRRLSNNDVNASLKEKHNSRLEGSSVQQKIERMVEEDSKQLQESSGEQKMKAPIDITSDALREGEDIMSSKISTEAESSKDRIISERCIEHCRLFIPDHEFDQAKLVRMWIAEECIDYEFDMPILVRMWINEECIELGAAERMEDVGNLYFDALVNKKVIVASKFDNFHKEMKYKFNTRQVTDVLLKGGSYVSIDSRYSHEINREALHLSWQCGKIGRTLFDALKNLNQLRTLVMHEDASTSITELPHDIFLGLKLLKTLDLGYTSIAELPSSIRKLKSLQYLDISETPIKQLPQSLDCLDCLQTLNLKDCFGLSVLPRGLGTLVNLRHLDFDIISQLKSMPRGMGNLIKLQTLPGFIVTKNDGCRIRELKNMNEITGSFCISRLENVSDVEEAKEAALCNKKYIDKLELRWQDCGNGKDIWEILESLQPHCHLKELQLTNYGGSKLPGWISDPSYDKLASVTLDNCRNCDIMPSIGELPSLKILHILDMDNVRNINTLFCRNHETKILNSFPRLEKLILDGMLVLEEWNGVEDGDFPNLGHVSIRNCPKLRILPSLSNFLSLKHFEIIDCTQLISLPEGPLPDYLETLIISGCPELKERCRKDGGMDWPKISSVRNIWIDSEKISNEVQDAAVKERMPTSYDSLPTPLKVLCHCFNGLHEGRCIPIVLDDDVFCRKCEIYIGMEADFIPFCDFEPISANCIVAYVWQLYNKMKDGNTLRRFQFVNPFSVSHLGDSHINASALVDTFSSTSPNQLVLAPCNVGERWILTVIQPYKEVVSLLDPIGRYNYEPWKDVVNMAISKFNDNLGKQSKEHPTWEVIKAPLQDDSKLCGYYVMRYLKEIVEGLETIDSSSLSSLFVNEEYSPVDINEVRIEWALRVQEHVSDFISQGGSATSRQGS